MKKWIVCFVALSTCLSAKETVVCIHGFMRTAKSMKTVEKTLKEKKFQPILWEYPSRDRTIEVHGAVLARHLKKVARRSKGEPIYFYTHSMGGLVLRAALNHPDCPEEAKYGKAVLLSPPNQGSQLAKYLHTLPPMRKLFGKQGGNELMTEKDFEHLGPFPPTLDILIISGTTGWNPLLDGQNDGKVAVHEAALTTPHKHITVPAGHSWIMRSKPAIENALAFYLQ